MRKRTTKILAMLLSVAMALSMLPGQALAAGPPFTDVSAGKWYSDAVSYVYEKQLMQGTDDTTFSPDVTTTRGMVVTVLHRMEGSPAASGGTSFADVASGQYYANGVAWASANGIVGGYGNGRFGPQDTITREQLASILCRYAQHKGFDVSGRGDLSAFQDAGKISDYAKEAVAWAVQEGLLNGVREDTIAPAGGATRAQVAAILMRFCENIVSENQADCTVTFALNDGSGGTYKTEKVQVGKTVGQPADPVRKGYRFGGWYTQAQGGEKYDFTKAITADLTLYARWTANPVGGGGGSGGGSSGSVGADTAVYSITDVTVKGKKVTATLTTDQACVMRVQLLDDTGTIQQTQVQVDVLGELELEKVEATLDVTPPQYFQVNISLLDNRGNELCTNYLCIQYTSAYAEFDAKTVNDFPGQTVLNFDEKDNDNFGVLSKDVVEVDSENITVSENTYTFSNSDSTLDGLKAGDTIAVFNEENDVEEVVKVRKITEQDGNVVVEADPELYLEDIYDFLKVDMEYDTDAGMVTPAEGVTVTEIDDTEQQARSARLQGSFGAGFKMGAKFEVDHAKLGIETEIFSKTEVELKYSPHLFKEDYFYMKASEKISATVTADLKAEVDIDNFNEKGKEKKTELKLGHHSIPTNIPGLMLGGEITVPFTLKGSVGAEFNMNAYSEAGLEYSSTDGLHKIKKGENDTTVSVTADGEIGVALKPAFNVSFMEKVLKFSVGPEVGVKVKGEMANDLTHVGSAQSIHACIVCVNGSIEPYFKITAKLSFNIMELLKGTVFDATLGEWKLTLLPWYLSLKSELESEFKDKVHFGEGSCPNQKYRTSFAVKNSNGNAVKDVSVVLTQNGQSVGTVSNGVMYLYKGSYTAEVTVDGKTVTKDFTVKDKALNVDLVIGADHPNPPPVGDPTAAPVELKWGRDYQYSDSEYDSIPGCISWKAADASQTDFALKIYNTQNTAEPVWEMTWHFDNDTTMYHSSTDFITGDFDSGTYYFTVQSVDGENPISGLAQSETWNYIKPKEAKLGTVAKPTWNDPYVIFTPLQNDVNVRYYELECYFSKENASLNTVDGTDVRNCGWILVFNADYENGKVDKNSFLDDDIFAVNGPGYYYFRVRAVSGDITQVQNGEWSALSDTYHYTGS